MNQTTWIETFQQLLHYCVPPITPSPALDVTCIVAVFIGVYLAFRAARSERMVVSCFGFLLGGWIGWRLADMVGMPGPITAAAVGVVVTVIAYRTYRFWLVGGSVIVLFLAALFFQLGRGDLQRYLPNVTTTVSAESEEIQLPSAEEQQRRSNPDIVGQLSKVKDRLLEEVKGLGPMGWLLPLAAGVLGALLAFWSLRVFAVIWLGLLGAMLALIGAATFACAHWPSARNALFAEPRGPFAAMLALWIAGLIVQAKAARLPARKAPPPPPQKEAAPA